MLTRRGLLMGAAALGSAGVIAATKPRRSYEDPDAVYDALHSQPATTLDLGGGKIDIVFADGAAGLERERTLRWVKKSAQAVTTYFGRYPTQRYGLLILTEAGDRVGHATTYGHRGPVTRIHVGTEAGELAFNEDWVLVHEMVHTALPDLPRRALWLQEGNATWVEPIARAQAGQLPISEVWRQALGGMPAGMRVRDASGMDGTRDWGRLYWGGAIFWLQAEIAIYEQSMQRFLLRDALRAINRTSGGIGAASSPEEMMAVGDQATGTTALIELYRDFSLNGVPGNLAAMFDRLGVSVDTRSGVRLNASAELAALTDRITRQ